MKEKIRLSGVPETMLQTVYARAKESRGRGAIHDAKAEEIIEKLDYDFSLADKDTAMHSGVIARTIVLGRLTKAWLGAHPGAVVVNIACGLDTRCYRMSGYAHWYTRPYNIEVWSCFDVLGEYAHDSFNGLFHAGVIFLFHVGVLLKIEWMGDAPLHTYPLHG